MFMWDWLWDVLDGAGRQQGGKQDHQILWDFFPMVFFCGDFFRKIRNFLPGAHKKALLGSWGAEGAAGDEQPQLGRCTGCCSGTLWLQGFSQLTANLTSVLSVEKNLIISAGLNQAFGSLDTESWQWFPAVHPSLGVLDPLSFLSGFQSVDTRLKRGRVKFWGPCHLSFTASASKSQAEVSKYQSCSYGASAILYKSHNFGSQDKQKARMEELDPNLPLKREMWLESLMAGPSAALDFSFVLCPAGICVQCDGALLIHLFSFIFWSKLAAILAVSRWICNIYFEKEKELRRLPRCPAVIILPAL